MTQGVLLPPLGARGGAMPASRSPSRPRRSQAERSADTREKLIQAAITCLHRTGYSATTISTVADEAGVSRGAITHQFPAKTDLMLAVVDAAFEQDAAFYRDAVTGMEPGQFLVDLPELMWSVMSRPGGIAVMEVMLASRSDPELAEKLRALQSGIDDRAHLWSRERLLAAGLEPHPEADAIHELYVAAVRGLALEATFMDNTEGVHRSLKVLSDIMRRFYPPLGDKRG